MSQQGIFNIAPDDQEEPSSSSGGGGENGSSVAMVNDQSGQFAETGSHMPEHRREAQSSSIASAAVAARGEPFQMNGFKPQTGNEVMEAAPVAAAPEASAFMTDQGHHHDYEAAKANLEPQQDFAAVPPHFGTDPASSSWEFASGGPDPAPAQSRPVQASIDPQQQAPPYSAQVAPPVQPSTVSSIKPSASSGMQQLELRAIFGVDYVLDINQILQRARSLPGILNVAIVGEREALALANFRLAIQGMGLGDFDQMKLNSNRGSVDFISEGNTNLAIQMEGSYAPGVKETLIIVAREIGKLV